MGMRVVKSFVQGANQIKTFAESSDEMRDVSVQDRKLVRPTNAGVLPCG